MERNWDGTNLYQYQGFWLRLGVLEGTISFQRHFQAQDTDIILSSNLKSGTTWLKALTFSIINRNRCPLNHSPLLTTNPRDLVRFLDLDLYFMKKEYSYLQDLPSSRILAAHTPYSLLPASIKDDHSKCRIVYLCRNPLDRFTSFWHFINAFPTTQPLVKQTSVLEHGLEMFCRDIEECGPFWDHELEYWKMSCERTEKVLFLKFEDLKDDIITNMKRIADFLGVPFSEEEEKQGMIEEISRLRSFQSLKNMEVN